MVILLVILGNNITIHVITPARLSFKTPPQQTPMSPLHGFVALHVLVFVFCLTIFVDMNLYWFPVVKLKNGFPKTNNIYTNGASRILLRNMFGQSCPRKLPITLGLMISRIIGKACHG